MAPAVADDASLSLLYRDVLAQCTALLRRFAVAYEERVLSALLAPDDLRSYAAGAFDRGIREVIVLSVTGHLAGMIKAFGHRLSVTAVPIGRDSLESMTALLSTVQMPKSAPVSVVGINSGANAALVAVGGIAKLQPELWALLDAYHEEARQAVQRSVLPE